jgi:hypothetical protein
VFAEETQRSKGLLIFINKRIMFTLINVNNMAKAALSARKRNLIKNRVTKVEVITKVTMLRTRLTSSIALNSDVIISALYIISNLRDR